MIRKSVKFVLLASIVCINGLSGTISKNSTELSEMISPLKITTFNLRRKGSETNPVNLWDVRKENVEKIIGTINPDIIGFQEVTNDQRNDLTKMLPEYAIFGLPRSAKMTSSMQKWIMKPREQQSWLRKKIIKQAHDEASPIAYKTDKFKLLKEDSFGINPAGRLLKAFLPRICTWGKFEEIATAKQFYVYNTHLDNSSSIIRRKQIKKVMNHVKKHTEKNIPIIFIGDLNTALTGKKKPRIIKNAGFVHTKTIAQSIIGPKETRNGWNDEELKTIDHIFIRAKNPIIKSYQVVTSPKGSYPSDHRPVTIQLQL